MSTARYFAMHPRVVAFNPRVAHQRVEIAARADQRLRATTSARSCRSRRRPRASESEPFPNACSSIQIADSSAASTHLVRVTHPFHPLCGQQLICVGERYNRYGKRLLQQLDEATVCSVPLQWTDIVSADPELVMGGGRALLRVVDLMELEGLVTRLVVGRRLRCTENDDV